MHSSENAGFMWQNLSLVLPCLWTLAWSVFVNLRLLTVGGLTALDLGAFPLWLKTGRNSGGSCTQNTRAFSVPLRATPTLGAGLSLDAASPGSLRKSPGSPRVSTSPAHYNHLGSFKESDVQATPQTSWTRISRGRTHALVIFKTLQVIPRSS